MEEERQALLNEDGDTISTASTPKTDNHGNDTDLGWSSGEDYDSQDADMDHDEAPNKNTTESILNLGDNDTVNIENDTDAQIQAQVNKSLSQKTYKTIKELLQAKAILRAEQLAAARSKKQSKSTSSKQNNKKTNLTKSHPKSSNNKSKKNTDPKKI